MCRALNVTKSGYLRWRHRPRSDRELRDVELTRQIASIQAEHRQVYGSPRVHAVLRRDGESISRKRVARLMREAGLGAETPRVRVMTTDSDHESPIADNVLDRDFTASAPNQTWVTDITYIPTDEGWLYLSTIIDLFSRKAVGWAMGETLATSLVTTALDQALANRRPGSGLLHHSDRGSQYASGDYRARLTQAGITISMSRRGNCHDNACAESFWARLKVELVYRRHFATRAEARQAIFEYIEVFYNRTRIHSAIGYDTPEHFEEVYHAAQHQRS
jgi:transposase InsO family protein